MQPENNTRLPLRAGFDPKQLEHRWAMGAERANEARAFYQAMLLTQPTDDPRNELTALMELLEIVRTYKCTGLLSPGVLYDMRKRAETILDAALPDRREHAKFSPGDAIDTLVGEAQFALTKSVVLQASGSATRWSAAYVRMRCRLVELWVQRGMALNATDRELQKASQRCLKLLEKTKSRTANSDDALEMVAALFDSSPGMVKKVRGRRLHQPDKTSTLQKR